MRFPIGLIASVLAIGAIATPLEVRGEGPDRDQNHDSDYDKQHDKGGLEKICHGLKTQDRGCVRYTRGFDVTGVLTTVTLTFEDGIKDACDCIEACLDQPNTCTTYVWKFTDNTGPRTCTLYSNFNLPSGVNVTYNPNESVNNTGLNPISMNPQLGGAVPTATQQNSTKIDEEAVSGPVWQLDNGQVQC